MRQQKSLSSIKAQALVVALYQAAALAIGLLRLVTSRTAHNIQRLEQRLAELTPPLDRAAPRSALVQAAKD
jgi:hypothetical protein